MKTTIIKIGNSKGVRIPKPLLEEAGLKNEVDMKVKDGGILIKPVRKKTKVFYADTAKRESMVRSYGPGYSALAKDWDTPEEDEAWAYLQ